MSKRKIMRQVKILRFIRLLNKTAILGVRYYYDIEERAIRLIVE